MNRLGEGVRSRKFGLGFGLWFSINNSSRKTTTTLKAITY